MKIPVVFALFLFCCLPVWAQFEEPDYKPGMPITNGNINAMARHNGKLFIGGPFNYVGYYTGAGMPMDPGTGALLGPKLYVRGGAIGACVPDGSGGWFIGGGFNNVLGVPRRQLAHILSNGTLDMAWDPEVAGGGVSCLKLQGNSLFVGGEFMSVDGVVRPYFVEIDASTGQLTSLDLQASSFVYALHTINNVMYIGGSFDNIGGVATSKLASFNLTSRTISAFNITANGPVLSIASLGSKLYLGGNFTSINATTRNYVAAIELSNGSLDGWNPSAQNTVFTLVSDANYIYVGGSFSSIGGQPRTRVAQFTPSSSVPTAWDASCPGTVRAIALVGATVYIGGQFNNIAGQTRFRVVAVNNTTGAQTSWPGQSQGNVLCITPSENQSKIFVGGDFYSIGGKLRSRVASIEEATGEITDFNPVAGDAVWAFAFNGNTLYMGGNFLTMGGQTRRYTAAVDATTGALLPWDPNSNSTITSLVVRNNRVFLGGSFTNLGGQTMAGLAEVDRISGAPTSWKPITAGTVFRMENRGDTLYLGGSFTQVGGLARSRIAAIDLNTLSPTSWNPGANDEVRAMHIAGDSLYVGGRFTTCGGQSRTRIARFALPSGQLSPWKPSFGSVIYDMLQLDDVVYVAGTQLTVNSTSTAYLTALDINSGAVVNWLPQVSGNILQLVNNNNTIYASGQFLTARGINSNSLAALSAFNCDKTAPTVTASGSLAFAVGGSVTLTASAASSYLWNTGETTQSITINSSGSYSVRTFVPGCTTNSSLPVVVTVTPASSNVWIWTGTDDYTNTANWNKGTLPDPGADSVIIQSGTCTVTAPVSFTRLYVAAGATFNLVQTDLSINTQLNVAGTVTGADQTSITFGTGGTVLGSGTIQVNSLKLPAGQLLIYAQVKVKEVDATGQLVLRIPGELRYVTGHTHASHWVHNASQSLVMDNPDQFVMEMHLDPSNAIATGAWYNVGPPIQNYRVGNLEQGFSFAAGTYNNAIPTSSSLYLYDPTDNVWPTNNGYIKASSANQTLTDQQGVRLWLTQARIAAGPIEFKGNPFLTLPLTYNLSYCASGCTYGSPNGFNLVKNPLLTGLNFGDPAKTPRNNLSSALWVWRQNLGQFASYSGGIGVNGGTDIVKPGQAFFVQATGPAATLQITYDSGEQEDGSIFRRPAVDNVIRLKLTQGSRALDETAIRFLPQATTGYDAAYDAAKMMGTSTSISSMMGNQRYAINALPLPATAGTTRIPLHLSAALTNQSIRIETEALAQGTTLYLNHPSMSQPMPVQHGTTVQVQAGWDSGLELIVVPASITTLPSQLTPTLTLIPNPATTAVQVHITATLEHVQVVDQLGRTVLTTTTLPNQMLDISTLAAGSYLVKARTAQGVVQQRLAVVR